MGLYATINFIIIAIAHRVVTCLQVCCSDNLLKYRCMAVIIATLVYHIEAGTDYIPTQRQSVIQNAADYVRRFFAKMSITQAC